LTAEPTPQFPHDAALLLVLPMLAEIKEALPLLPRALARWFRRSFLRTIFDRYRPEQHYMRGSGPKCRLKQSRQDATSH
jgi:hypothetical protein